MGFQCFGPQGRCLSSTPTVPFSKHRPREYNDSNATNRIVEVSKYALDKMENLAKRQRGGSAGKKVQEARGQTEAQRTKAEAIQKELEKTKEDRLRLYYNYHRVLARLTRISPCRQQRSTVMVNKRDYSMQESDRRNSELQKYYH